MCLFQMAEVPGRQTRTTDATVCGTTPRKITSTVINLLRLVTEYTRRPENTVEGARHGPEYTS